MAVLEISSNEFEQKVLNAKKPVLVDFFTVWCGDCRRISPVLDIIAEKNTENFDVYKVNTDKNTDLAKKYEVQAVPTLRFFKNGTVSPKLVEPSSKAEIDTWIKKNI